MRNYCSLFTFLLFFFDIRTSKRFQGIKLLSIIHVHVYTCLFRSKSVYFNILAVLNNASFLSAQLQWANNDLLLIRNRLMLSSSVKQPLSPP